MSGASFAFIESLSRRRALVIGDVMLDHYISGEVHRISPEAPVPVMRVQSDRFSAGGAANVAINLASLGVRTELIGTLGKDPSADLLRAALRANRVVLADYWGSGSLPTIVKTRIIARTQQICRFDREAQPKEYALPNDAATNGHLKEALSDADAVIVSDYAKGVITQALYDQIVELAHECNVLLAVDPKPGRPIAFHGADLLTPNRHEALQLAGFDLLDTEEFPTDEACRIIHRRYQPKSLVVTLGAAGMIVARAGEVVAHLPTVARKVFDVSGAGDTVIATLVACLISGCELVEAAKIANVAAGIVVGQVGTVAPTVNELLSALACSVLRNGDCSQPADALPIS